MSRALRVVGGGLGRGWAAVSRALGRLREGHRSASPRQRRVVWGVACAVAAALVAIPVSCGVSSRLAARRAAEEAIANAPNPQLVAATEDMPAYLLLDAGRTTDSGPGRVSFAAFGDNLMNANLLELADGWAGEVGDGVYDFAPFYEEIRPLVQDAYDVSLVNQETVMGGTENYGYMGWPSYNTPDGVADALDEAGFRLVATNSNHTYDTWVDSIVHDHAVWDAHPTVLTAGSYDSEQDRQTVRVVECNGLRIAFLAYSYGQNGYTQADLPNAYYAVPYDKQTIADDVERAKRVSDFVLVYMHWGAPEYVNDVNDEQRELAQWCADLGVGMVVGSHVHVIQPMEWVERAGGGQMLCAYGLGDFVAGYEGRPADILSGMLTCEIVRSGDEVVVEDVLWRPLVEHREGTRDLVCLASAYTEERARANELLSTLEDPYDWIFSYTRDVIGDDFAIDAPAGQA